MITQLIRGEKFTNIQKAQAGLTRLFRLAAKRFFLSGAQK